MPALTSLGIGSGIDLNTMLTQLVALERKPLEQMKAEASKLQTKVSSFGQIQSLVSRIQDAANKLKGTAGAGVWAQSVARSANESVVSAAGGSTAAAGSYAVSVTSLAAAQTLISGAPFPDASALVGAGTLTIEVGSWSAGQAAFTAKPGTTAVTLEVGAADTAQTLRDKINSLGAGVSASLVNDANGTRLALRSTTTGAANGFRISAADADGNPTDAAGLSRIAFDPPAGTTGTLLSQAGANAVANVNGIAVDSASNELSGIVDGLTLRLRSASATPVEVDVSPDREAIAEAVKGLATAYSELARYIGQQTRYDPTAKVGGPLQGDSAVGGVLSRLRGVINNPSGATAAFARLSDIGLELQRDGSLAVDSGKLDKALGNLDSLKRGVRELRRTDTRQRRLRAPLLGPGHRHAGRRRQPHHPHRRPAQADHAERRETKPPRGPRRALPTAPRAAVHRHGFQPGAPERTEQLRHAAAGRARRQQQQPLTAARSRIDPASPGDAGDACVHCGGIRRRPSATAHVTLFDCCGCRVAA